MVEKNTCTADPGYSAIVDNFTHHFSDSAWKIGFIINKSAARGLTSRILFLFPWFLSLC